LETPKFGSTTSIDPRLLGVTTPLHLDSWKQHLRCHPNRDFANYILWGIQCVFHIGIKSPVDLRSATKNMSSSQQHPEIIDDYLKKEVALSNILGPFPSLSGQQSTSITSGLSQRNTNLGNGVL